MAGSPGGPEHADVGAEAQRDGHVVRSADLAAGAGDGDGAHRPSSPRRPTTYNEPYHVARKFASLDHISGGRAGWNLVTSGNPTEAWNFGRDEHWEHDTRYRRAREFYDVVTGLWDSWADDAFVRDVENKVYFDPEKAARPRHKGEFLKVRGPLNVARPIQGWPVIVQAGASEAGRQIAAETAEVIFAAGGRLADAQRFYADVKGRLDKLGRPRDHLKVLPGALVVVGDSGREARRKQELLDSLVHADSGLPNLSMRLGTDVLRLRSRRAAAGHPRNQCQPERPPGTHRSRPARQPHHPPTGAGSWAPMAGLLSSERRRQLPTRWKSGSIATPATGSTSMFPTVPQGLDEFVDQVVPELQRRGIFPARI